VLELPAHSRLDVTLCSLVVVKMLVGLNMLVVGGLLDGLHFVLGVLLQLLSGVLELLHVGIGLVNRELESALVLVVEEALRVLGVLLLVYHALVH